MPSFKAGCKRKNQNGAKCEQIRAVYGLKLAKEVGDLKAVPMNVMHSSIGITDSIYAVLNDRDMQQKIARLGQSTQSRPTVSDERIKAIVSEVLERLEGEPAG